MESMITSFNSLYEIPKSLTEEKETKTAFNSLYEILKLIEVYVGPDDEVTFNSLYEIHKYLVKFVKANDYDELHKLSILFMRFYVYNKVAEWCNSFDVLSILFMRFIKLIREKGLYSVLFQFSL